MQATVQEIRPDAAFAMLESDAQAVLLDVRSKFEFDYVGHPLGALNIPLMEPPLWQADPDFGAKVRDALRTRDTDGIKLLLLCRSGKRSHLAAVTLVGEGYVDVYNVVEGFEGDLDQHRHRSTVNGWRYRGLPWEQG